MKLKKFESFIEDKEKEKLDKYPKKISKQKKEDKSSLKKDQLPIQLSDWSSY
jgi:hypothetical protein